MTVEQMDPEAQPRGIILIKLLKPPPQHIPDSLWLKPGMPVY